MHPTLPKFFILLLILSTFAHAAKRRFKNIAKNGKYGLKYTRVPSRTHAAWQNTLKQSLTKPLPFLSAVHWPWATHGQPGVAVGDFNGDGIDDIYVTNGPGAANSLFINQLPSKGKLKFREVARRAGVESKSHDSTGVCYGDLNGDGRTDLVVLSEFDSNQIYLANPDFTFREINWKSATGDDSKHPSASCSIGDVNGDGKLDLLISNGVPRGNYLACLAVPWDRNSPNQLFINTGAPGTYDLSFSDKSKSSGINDFGGDVPAGKFTPTWVATLVDIDLDGDLDIVVADDQCGHPTKPENNAIGANRGAIRVQYNDGTGNFKSRTMKPVNAVANNRRPGGESWMGLGFGDFNCDGKMDFFGSNFGDYHSAKVAFGEGRIPDGKVGHDSSRWFIADNSAQGFTDASIAETGVTVFGWGNAVMDYDNDGDQDIVMVGSLDEPRAAGSDNPNIILKNDGCKAKFSLDLTSLQPTGRVRNYNGLAMGDFDMDGYPDVVAASGYVSDRKKLSKVYRFKSPLDKTAYFTDILTLNKDKTFTWTGKTLSNGDMMVQMNRPMDKTMCWMSVRPLGSQGLVKGGKVNRGALGSTIIVKPKTLPPVMAPIVSGESYGSQHSPRRNFGLGAGCEGMVDILWPGNVRNRLYTVKNKEMLTLPEIPCSYTGAWSSEDAYRDCVRNAVSELVEKDIVSQEFGDRLIDSASQARADYL